MIAPRCKYGPTRPIIKAQQKVIDLLVRCGWQQAGQTDAYSRGLVREGYWAGLRNWIPKKPRLRFPGSDRYVSVGQDRVCFYRVNRKRATQHKMFYVKDMARFAGSPE